MKMTLLVLAAAVLLGACRSEIEVDSLAGETLESYVIREALSDAPDPAKAKVLTLGVNDERTMACGTMRVSDDLVVPFVFLQPDPYPPAKRRVATPLIRGRFADKLATLFEGMCAKSGIVQRPVG